MSIANDLRAAATLIQMFDPLGLANRLRTHADTIERVEKEMREYKRVRHLHHQEAIEEWADALNGETT